MRSRTFSDEGSAQLATYFFKHRFPETADRFMISHGVDEFRFRAQVVAGDTLYLASRGETLKPRMRKFLVQGVKGGEIVFEGKILGAPIEVRTGD